MQRLLLTLLAFCGIAAAQNYTTVSASNIVDQGGNKLGAGTIYFLAVDGSNRPLSFQVGGGGQVLSKPISFAVTSGAIAGGAQVPNPADTSPAGIFYRVWITDATTHSIILMYPAAGCAPVTFSGSSFNLDGYQPCPTTLPGALLPATVTGPVTFLGPIAVSSCSGCGSTSGTVTNVGAGNLSPLFITWVTSPTSTPGINFALSSTSANYVFAGPSSGGSGAWSARQLVSADIPGTIASNTSGNSATATALASTPTLCTTGQAPTGVGASGNATGCTPFIWQVCTGKGLGDGLNAIPAGTYLQETCTNETAFTVTLSGITCFSDNNGSSTLNVADTGSNALLTGAITCTNSAGGAAGTQSATVTLAPGVGVKFTFVSDGTSKQTDWNVKGVF